MEIFQHPKLRPGALPPDPEAVDRLAREIAPVRMDAHAG